MFAMASLNTMAWTAAPFSWVSPEQPLRPLLSRRMLPAAAPRMDGSNAPSLRDQMKAYLKSVEERGVELTAEQKQMLAEFQDDDELLDQTGRPDFMKGYEVVSEEEFQARQQQQQAVPAAAPANPLPAPAPAAPSPAPLVMGAVATATAAPPPPAPSPPAPPPPAPSPAPAQVAAQPVAAAAVPAPTVIGAPVDPTAARLWMMQAGELDSACGLLQGYADGSLDATGTKELRKVLSSLICTLAAA